MFRELLGAIDAHIDESCRFFVDQDHDCQKSAERLEKALLAIENRIKAIESRLDSGGK